MALTHPIAAMHEALAIYLRTAIRAVSGLGDSECLKKWPQATEDLKLSPTRIVVGITRAGAPTSTRIGRPKPTKIDALAATKTARYVHDQLDQSLTLGLWAMSPVMRDEADQVLRDALNVPYWTTCPPTVSTYCTAITPIDKRGRPTGPSATTMPTAGRYLIAPASLDDVWHETRLRVGGSQVGTSIDADPTTETVRVEELTPFGFIVTTRRAHTLTQPQLREVVARQERIARGLSLRCSLHHNAPARFMFEEPQCLDNDMNSQTQQWRSVRSGVGSIPQITVINAPNLQNEMVIRGQTSTRDITSDTDPTPTSITVFDDT